MLRIPVLTILFCAIVSWGYAQDTTKKAAAVKPPVTKQQTPVVKTNPYRAPVTKPAVTAPAVQQQVAVKHDSIPPAPVLVDKSLNGQYQYLLTKVYHYQQPLISALWKNASDTLNLNRHKLRDAMTRLGTVNKTIDSLKAEVTVKEQNLTAANSHADAVDMFGIFLPKATYNLVMWGLVLVFGIAAFVVIARSGGYSREAKYRTTLYNELEDEFKAYKVKANEKEKKLARELQTERNKVDELLGKG